MAGRDPPFFLNSPEDRGAVVAVVAFTFAVTTTLINSIRVFIRQRKAGALGLDDALLVVANIIAVGQTALVGASIKHGLGRHINSLGHSLDGYYKYSYAAGLLAIPPMALAKFSVLHLERRLVGEHTTDRYIRTMHMIMSFSIAGWLVFSLFALAFQCGTTKPSYYTPTRCADGALWYPVTVLNALIDLVLAFSFSPIVRKLSTRSGTKVKIMCLLGARVFVCIATIVQIVSLARGLRSLDQTRAMITPVLTQQIVMNLSIITAILLSLHGFFANMTAGRFGVEVRQTEYELSQASSNKAKASASARSRKTPSWMKGGHAHYSSGHSGSRNTEPADDEVAIRAQSPNAPDLRPDLISKTETCARHDGAVDEWDKINRSEDSQENIIRQTVSWQVSRSTPPAVEEEPSRLATADSEPHETGARSFLI